MASSDDGNSSSIRLEKVVPRKYGIVGGINGEDLICLVENFKNSL
ncbi:hypothetical protein Gotri_013697 [Gossypium trilobum]|uniref:Uncharacterized protein n=1 Tax=Gossypium trilobum TaxID=34281 RepID=A0A7J9DUH1_9ROSI|nr:hypothetical protein [Gossypium trilobum]